MFSLPLPLGEGWGEGHTLLLPKKIRVYRSTTFGTLVAGE